MAYVQLGNVLSIGLLTGKAFDPGHLYLTVQFIKR